MRFTFLHYSACVKHAKMKQQPNARSQCLCHLSESYCVGIVLVPIITRRMETIVRQSEEERVKETEERPCPIIFATACCYDCSVIDLLLCLVYELDFIRDK